VPIGHKKETFILMLKRYPVLEYTMKMPQMQPTRWSHAGQYSLLRFFRRQTSNPS
jgi:hypothetical protein